MILGNFALPEDFTVTLDNINNTVTFKNGGYINLNVFISSENGNAQNLIISSNKLKELVGDCNTKTTELYVYVDKDKQVQTDKKFLIILIIYKV